MFITIGLRIPLQGDYLTEAAIVAITETDVPVPDDLDLGRFDEVLCLMVPDDHDVVRSQILRRIKYQETTMRSRFDEETWH